MLFDYLLVRNVYIDNFPMLKDISRTNRNTITVGKVIKNILRKKIFVFIKTINHNMTILFTVIYALPYSLGLRRTPDFR